MNCAFIYLFLRNINYYTQENCHLLGYYAARSANFLPTFRDNLSVASSTVKSPHPLYALLTHKSEVLIYFAAET